MVVIPYFVSKLRNTRSLKVSLLNCYSSEIDFILKQEKIIMTDFHVLDCLANIYHLREIEVNFNALDSLTFQRMVNFMKKNTSAINLTLNLFPSDDHFTLNNIIKYCEELNISMGNNFDSSNKVNEYASVVDDIEFAVNKLCESFADNMEKLFFVIGRNLYDLNNLHLSFELPNILSHNDKYLEIFHKFLFNLWIAKSIKSDSLQTFDILSSNLLLDARSNPKIVKFLDSFSFKDNKNIINMTLNMKIIKCKLLHNLLPPNLEFLTLQGIDIETLESLNLYLVKSPFGGLKYLKISLTNLFYNYQKDFYHILNFFKINKGKLLEELAFSSGISITLSQYEELLQAINYDPVKKYHLELSKRLLDAPVMNQQNIQLFYKQKTYALKTLLYIVPSLFKENARRSIVKTISDYLLVIRVKKLELKFI